MNHLLAKKSPFGSNSLFAGAMGWHTITACALAVVLFWAVLPAVCQGQAGTPPVHHPRNAIAHTDAASADKDREIPTESQKRSDPADACAQLRRQCIYAAEDRHGLLYIMCRSPLAGVTDDEGRTPLMMAVERGDIELTAFLLEMTENVNVKDHSGDTAIIRAAVHKHGCRIQTELIKMLLERGAEMSLFVAAALGDEQEARRLIQAGADVNTRTGTGHTPLLIALQSGRLAVARLLLDNGADVNAAASNGATPLFQALMKRDKTMQKVLIARGAKLSLPLAAQVGEWTEVHRLIDSGADVNMKGFRGETSLQVAADRPYVEEVKYLIEKGANVNTRDKIGFTPLINAVRSGRLDVVTLLTERGADVNARTKYGLTPLAAVGCADSSVEEAPLLAIAKYLLNKGAEVNFNPHETGLTPLMEAVQNKRQRLVKLLIERGADVNARTWCPRDMRLLPVLDCPFGPGPVKHDEAKKDRTSRGSFGMSYRTGVPRWLITYASMIWWNFDDGITPLMVAALSGDLEAVKLLIEAGADVNAKTTYNKKTALHTALGYEIIKTLIQHGADVNAQTSVGGTLLMQAARSPGEIGLCKLLVEHGANVNIRSRDGHTALDLAYGTLAQSERVVEYLKSKGAVSGLKHFQERDDLSTAN